MLGFGKKSKIKKPHFMKRKSWYVVLTPDYRMPEDPDIDMVLTPKASEKAIYSYQRYYGLGVLTIFFMENGSICEESIDIWSPKERAKEQEMHDAAFKESDFTMIKIENIKREHNIIKADFYYVGIEERGSVKYDIEKREYVSASYGDRNPLDDPMYGFGNIKRLFDQMIQNDNYPSEITYEWY